MRQNTIKLHTSDDTLQTGEAGRGNRGQQWAAAAEGRGLEALRPAVLKQGKTGEQRRNLISW